MNLIIPMAGKGKRLRPHTLTTPKPLIPIAGKPIVQRLVEDIARVTPEPIKNIVFVVGDFGEEVNSALKRIASQIGAQATIIEQGDALGTAHAVHCAKDFLEGKCIVAFADTLFKAEFTLNTSDDGIIWVKKVGDPSAYGVVKVNEDGVISEFVEKPKESISDLAIIGIYYFKEGHKLLLELDRMISENIKAGGEFQLTTALEELKQGGVHFTPGEVQEWLDCGNKQVTVESNSRYLGFLKESEVSETAEIINSTLIPPVYIGPGTEVRNSVVGPNVSIGANSVVKTSQMSNSLIQNNVRLINVNLTNSMIGNFVTMESLPQEVSLGDYTELKS